MQTIPPTAFHVVQLPIYVKSESSLQRVIGDEKKFLSSINQGTDVSMPLSPDNPLLSRVSLHAKPSTRLVLRVTKDGEQVNGSIIGRGID